MSQNVSASPRKSGAGALKQQLTMKKQPSLIPNSLMKRMSTINSNAAAAASHLAEVKAAETLKVIKETVDSIRGLKQLCQVTKQRVIVYDL